MARTSDSAMTSSHHPCDVMFAGWLATPLRVVINDPKRILRGLVHEGDTVVDLGCGPGFFSLPLARIAGETGRVIAVDVQEAMLSRLRRRAEKAGLASRIHAHLAEHDNIGVNEPADFILAFYMVHEVRDRDKLLRQVHHILKPGGRFLLVEPIVHVPKREYLRTVDATQAAGLVLVSKPHVRFSRAALFTRH